MAEAIALIICEKMDRILVNLKNINKLGKLHSKKAVGGNHD